MLRPPPGVPHRTPPTEENFALWNYLEMVGLAVADNTRSGKLESIVGGGDTVAALDACGVMGDITYVSTGGGAFLEFIEGRELPGIEVLREC